MTALTLQLGILGLSLTRMSGDPYRLASLLLRGLRFVATLAIAATALMLLAFFWGATP